MTICVRTDREAFQTNFKLIVGLRDLDLDLDRSR